jgi:hypothetical protein
MTPDDDGLRQTSAPGSLRSATAKRRALLSRETSYDASQRNSRRWSASSASSRAADEPLVGGHAGARRQRRAAMRMFIML